MRPPALGATAIPLMRAWACGLRTKATSCVWGSCTSETNCPRPRKWRASSLRRSDAPTPEVVFATARVMRLSFDPLHRRMRPDRKHSKPAPVPCQQAASGLGFGLGFWTWLLDLALDLARKRCQGARSRGRVVHAAFFPMGGVELRRHRAAIDLAGAVERQRSDNVDKTGMRIGRPLGQAIGLEILGRHA